MSEESKKELVKYFNKNLEALTAEDISTVPENIQIILIENYLDLIQIIKDPEGRDLIFSEAITVLISLENENFVEYVKNNSSEKIQEAFLSYSKNNMNPVLFIPLMRMISEPGSLNLEGKDKEIISEKNLDILRYLNKFDVETLSIRNFILNILQSVINIRDSYFRKNNEDIFNDEMKELEESLVLKASALIQRRTNGKLL